MKRLLISALLLSLPAWATVYTVKAAGGGNYTTIQACATAAVAGDTCVVYAGTYHERVLPAHSGSTGLPITFKANAGDVVNVDSFDVSLLKYITIGGSGSTEGFAICNGYSANACISSDSSSYITIQHDFIGGSSTSNAGGSTGCINNSFGSAHNSDHFSILNNTIQWCGTINGTSGKHNGEAALYLRGDYWLIDGNDMEHVSDFLSNSAGSFAVARNNTLQNVDCLNDFDAAEPCHVDGFEISTNTNIGSLSFALFENNVMKNVLTNGGGDSGSGVHGILWHAGLGVTNDTVIERFNTYWNISTLPIQGDCTQGGTCTNLKFYNNTTAVNATKASYAVILTSNATNAASINNLYYGVFRTDINVIGLSTDSTSAATLIAKNDGFYQSGALGYAGYAASETGVVTSNPLFTNVASGDFTLQGTSPALKAGSYLTTVVSGGGTSSIVVADAHFFSDPTWGGGITPEVLRIGTTNTYTVASVNYSTNTITFTGTATASPGDGVYLYKDSNGTQRLFNTNPDMGAYQSGSAAPTAALTATPSITLAGANVTLASTCTNSTSASIDQGVGSVSSTTDTRVVNPITQTTYTLTCTGAGGSAQASVTVSIGGVKIGANVKLGANVKVQ